MPNAQLQPSPIQLLRAADPANDAEFDRLATLCLADVLGSREVRSELLPPGRRAWFEAFLRRCLEGAALHEHLDDFSWREFTRSMVNYGVLNAVVGILRQSRDPDGKEERRGIAFLAQDQDHAFLQDRADLREILGSAIACRDVEQWGRFPGWYGHGHHCAQSVLSVQAEAARFLPIFSIDDPLLRSLLGEEFRNASHIAAVRLAKSAPDAVGEDDLLQALLRAASDKGWLWSYRDHYAVFMYGYHEALLFLGPYGRRAQAAIPILEEEILKRRSDTSARYKPWIWDEWVEEAEVVLGKIAPPSSSSADRLRWR